LFYHSYDTSVHTGREMTAEVKWLITLNDDNLTTAMQALTTKQA